jgi:hypothetical protein
MPGAAAPSQAFGGGQIAVLFITTNSADLSKIDTTVRAFRLERPRLYFRSLVGQTLVDRRSVAVGLIRIVL